MCGILCTTTSSKIFHHVCQYGRLVDRESYHILVFFRDTSLQLFVVTGEAIKSIRAKILIQRQVFLSLPIILYACIKWQIAFPKRIFCLDGDAAPKVIPSEGAVFLYFLSIEDQMSIRHRTRTPRQRREWGRKGIKVFCSLNSSVLHIKKPPKQFRVHAHNLFTFHVIERDHLLEASFIGTWPKHFHLCLFLTESIFPRRNVREGEYFDLHFRVLKIRPHGFCIFLVRGMHGPQALQTMKCLGLLDECFCMCRNVLFERVCEFVKFRVD
mmetsp:Transcript_15924/g.44641  ORF Transcript_15924/g.44641 Transcript_15924/m.44641 type:complete len:269 (-) Transcript_15924:354-1160(-)